VILRFFLFSFYRKVGKTRFTRYCC